MRLGAATYVCKLVHDFIGLSVDAPSWAKQKKAAKSAAKSGEEDCIDWRGPG